MINCKGFKSIFFVRCVDSIMLLSENCRELSFQAKSINLCSADYAKK